MNNNSISPLDGRYYSKVEELSDYFTEKSLAKYRLSVEILYLLFFLRTVNGKKVNHFISSHLIGVLNSFNDEEFGTIKEFERTTNHDVKAVELYVKSKMSGDLCKYMAFVHFGLTSEDTNNLAYAMAMTEVNKKIIFPDLDKLIKVLIKEANRNKNLVMPARTHGQKAVPTTLGKEFGVFAFRLSKYSQKIKNYEFEGKLNGAVGNYNALDLIYPGIDWISKSRDFVENLNLKWNPLTTQIEPSDSLTDYFYLLKKINLILIGLCQDIWRYVSDDYFSLKIKKSEAGSSTMPQKVNPIMFENAEGNLKLANSLFDLFINNLPVSRLQRDLSDSTIKRNIGVGIAHTILSIKMILNGLNLLEANKEKIIADLNSDYTILAEAVQLLLKKSGDEKAYELVRDLTRGKKQTKEQYRQMIEKLEVNADLKSKLMTIRPENYSGYAAKLVTKYL